MSNLVKAEDLANGMTIKFRRRHRRVVRVRRINHEDGLLALAGGDEYRVKLADVFTVVEYPPL